MSERSLRFFLMEEKMEDKVSEKKDAIIKATIELVAEKGFHATPTSAIAEKAEVGVGSIYRYFKDKDELIHAAHQVLHSRFQDEIRKGYDIQAPIRERFFHLYTRTFYFLKENTEEYKFIEQYFNSPYGTCAKRAKCNEDMTDAELKEQPLMDLFKSAKEQQIIKDLSVTTYFAITFGPITFLLRDYNAGFAELNDEIINQVIEACWDAVKR